MPVTVAGGVPGIFGGTLAVEQGRSFEPAPGEVLAMLARGGAPAAVAPAAAELVRFRAEGGRVEIDGDLSGLAPLGAAGLAVPDAVAVLGRVASVLSAMHAVGEVHGDLGPWSVRVGGGRVVVLAPPPGVPAGALVAARVRAGAPLGDVAFCSAGVLAGREEGPAGDVYALAGLAYWLVSGELPVGRVDLSAAASGPLGELARLVAAGLSTTPGARPLVVDLEGALGRAAPSAPGEQARAIDTPDAEAAPGPARSGALAPGEPRALSPGLAPEPGSAEAQGKQLSTVLGLLLAVGGLFVLVGALWLVAVGWSVLGEGGRAALLFALTAGIFGGGIALRKRGYESSGFALAVLASQMLWADGGYVLHLADALSSPGAWSAVAAVVTAASVSLAVRRRSLGVGVLAAVGFAVFAICFNTATGRPGQLAFFSALTLVCALGGMLAERRSSAALGAGLLAAGAQLLWIDAACALDLVGMSSSEGAWTAVGFLVFAATTAIAVTRRSAGAGVVAFLDFLVFAAIFSHATGRPGQLGLMLAVTALVAAIGDRLRKTDQEPLGAALIVVATRLLWADAALLLDLVGLVDRAGPWALASSLVLAATYGVAVSMLPAAAVFAALDAAVFASCFGAYISRGDPLGPPVYLLGVAWLYAALAAGARRRQVPGGPVLFAGFGLLCALGSAFLGVGLLSSEEHLLFGSLWPLAPLVSLLPFALRGPDGTREVARLGVAVLLALVPAGEALMRPADPAYVVVAAVLGVGMISVALGRASERALVGGVAVGLIDAGLVPSVAFLGRCLGEGGAQALLGPLAPYMLAAFGAPLALLVAAVALGPGSSRKEGYRLVEVAALGQLFGLATLASLAHATDFFYPGLILLSGVFALGLGVARRHVVVVALTSGALMLNLWIQYFQKLRDAFPLALLVIGFGIGLLIAGVIYERMIRQMLPKLKDWS